MECAMGNLVADAMLDRVRTRASRSPSRMAAGLRASIDAGEITMGEVLTVLPFQNTLATFDLKGSDVVAALENGVSTDRGRRRAVPAGCRHALHV
jgi:5'-nucleotidase/UDP-sugar diphosphatase